jgi:hypothetical protein
MATTTVDGVATGTPAWIVLMIEISPPLPTLFFK